MIGKLIFSIRRNCYLTSLFSVILLFFFAALFLVPAHCRAQTKGGKVVNTTVQKPVTGESYAIIFGVSNYPGLTPLKYADKDAALFRDFLETPAGGNTKPENIFYRTNEDAKAADFNVDAYIWLKRKALKEGDRLYIYFSGHGDAMNEDNYFLLPYDCTPNNDINNYLATGRIEMYHVKTLFIKPLIQKKVEVLLIVDACRTNDLPGGQQGQANFVNYVQSIAEQKEGEIIMLSTGAGQSAIESPKIGSGHGLFTWYLVAGLSGDADKEGDAADHDGKVSLAEITSYVRNKVRKEAKKEYNTDQVPVFLPPDKDLETIAMVDSGTYANWSIAENMRQQTTGNDNMVVVNKKPGKKAVAPNSLTDTALIALDNKFIAAVKNGDLSGKNSAEAYYTKMEEKWPTETITNDAKYALATEFINFSQEKINLYLSGKGKTHIQHLENAYKTNNKTNKVAANKDKNAVKNIPTAIEEQIIRMKTIASTGFDKAAEMMEKAIKLLKNDPELLESLYPKLYFLKAGSLQYSSNTAQKKQAIFFVRKAISKDVSAAYNYELLGELLKDFDNDSCKIYYQKAIALAPKWAYPENGIGNYYNDRRDYKLALIHYNNAVKLDSLDEIVYQNIGSMYHNLAMPDSAKKYYLKALSIDSCDFYACANLGSLYKDSITAKNKSYYVNLSSGYFKRALKCNSEYSWAYVKIAQLFDQIDLPDSSLYYCKKGVLKNPDNASLYRNLANEYLYQKDSLNAEKYYNKALSLDSLDITNYMTLGWFYKRMGLSLKVVSDPDPKKYYSKSILNYQKAIQLDPGYKYAYNSIGLVYNTIKMYDKALQNYQKAIALDSGYSLAYNNLGNIYYAQKAYDKALPDYLKAIQTDSTFASPYYNIGLIYDNQKKFDKAIMYYNKSVLHDPTDATTFTSLGDIYYNQKIYDKAVINYEKAMKLDSLSVTICVYLGDAYHKIKMYDKAILNYQKGLRLDPANVSAYNALGNVYYEQKLYDNAIFNYQKVIHLDSAYAAPLYNLGLVYTGQKEYDKAIQSYQKAIYRDSAYSSAYYELAYIFYDQKIYDKAILNYQKTIHFDPANVSAYNALGNVYYDQKIYDKAIFNYQKAIQLDTGYTSPYFNLGLIYNNQKDYDKAILSYQKVIFLDSTYTSAYFNLALIYDGQKAFDKALLNYQKTIHLDTAYTSAYYDIGLIYDDQKAYDKAIVYYKKACLLDPANAAYMTNLGYAYVYSKDFKKGIPLLEKALTIKTEDPWSYYNLACAWSLASGTDKGMMYLKNALDKGFKDYDHIRQDNDIANLKNTKEFNTLMKQYFPDK